MIIQIRGSCYKILAVFLEFGSSLINSAFVQKCLTRAVESKATRLWKSHPKLAVITFDSCLETAMSSVVSSVVCNNDSIRCQHSSRYPQLNVVSVMPTQARVPARDQTQSAYSSLQLEQIKQSG